MAHKRKIGTVTKGVFAFIACTSLCLSAQAQTTESLEKYNTAITSQESFNKIQREAGMPEMPILSFKEWEQQSKQALASAISVEPRETIEDKKARMRKWINPGIRQQDGMLGKAADIYTVRRERLWARSAQRIRAHKQEMIEAREWIRQHRFDESAILSDGSVIGLVGIRDGIPRYNTTYNAGAADTISVDELWPNGSSGLNLTGTNVLIGIWDGGDVQTAHSEFSSGGQSRIIDMDGTSPLPTNEHPTAVAGTMVASGVNFSGEPQGMAYQATVWAYDWQTDITEMPAAYANGMRVSNHSYGEQAGWGTISIYQTGTYNKWGGGIVTLQAGSYDCWWGDIAASSSESFYFGLYTQAASDTDNVAYGNPHSLPIWSAGNDRNDEPPYGEGYISFYNGITYYIDPSQGYLPPDYYSQGGYDTISDHGLAKNVLTVGAVNKIAGGYSGISSVILGPFSGYGPTDDGRIKPDVVAAGVDLTSPVWNPANPSGTSFYSVSTGNNSSPSYATGTSFSAPSATGAAGLIVGLREQLNPGVPFLASTLKVVLTHTADEAEATGPDYKTGWGLLNVQRAAELVQSDSDESGKQFIKEVMLNSEDYIEFPVTAIGDEMLKISIGWTDPAGTPPPTGLDPTDLMLINDLDLRVVNASGTTNFPWVLNPAIPSSIATTGDNFRDNTEQVVVSNPTAQAVYTVHITHKGNLVDDTGAIAEQAVSIVLSGIVPESRPQLKISEFVATSASELVEWPSVVGQNYRMQATTNLVDTAWSDSSAEISATKTNTVWEETSPASVSARFYRLIETN